MTPNCYSSSEQMSLIGELTQGFDLAKQLKAYMGHDVSSGTEGKLLERILSSYEKSLSILQCAGSAEQSQQHLVPSSGTLGSPISDTRSPKSEDFNPSSYPQPDNRDLTRKRKMMSSWTKQEKVSIEAGQEGHPDDGFSWRKYGQKEIQGAKHPRSYYRCTYRNIQGCCAIKQVQRNDEDPSVFDITYKGSHTCKPNIRSKSAPTSPVKQQRNKQNIFPTVDYHQQPDVMLNFHTTLNIDVQNLENQEKGFSFSSTTSGYENQPFTSTFHDNSFYNNFQPPFAMSPTTSESNIFSTSPCYMTNFGGVHHRQHAESDTKEIISATTSGTNSPIIGTDIQLDPLEFNPGFPYDSEALFQSFSQAKEQSPF